LKAKGLDVSDHTLDSKLAHFFDEAKRQIVAENT
jgi:hypothetical protein